MKPIISYYGGKQKMAHNIIPLIPKHTVYVEPFAGGCAILFMKPYPNVANFNYYSEVINDIDGDLINMYRIFQSRFDEIKHLLDYTLYSQEEHRKSAKILKREIEADDLWRSWAYFVNVCISFSKKLKGGWATSVFGGSLVYSFKNKINYLSSIMDRFRNVYISCEDSIRCIERWDSPQTLFYCDPPYIDTDQGHYKGYRLEDFNKLVEKLQNIQGSFLLSTYEIDGFSWPTDWERFEFNTVCSAIGRGKVNISDKSRVSTKEELGDIKRTELVFRKISDIKPRPEILKLYKSGKFDCFKGNSKRNNGFGLI